MKQNGDEIKDEYVIRQSPPVVGYWDVCGQDLQFHLTKHPSKWNQFWCAYLIGWKWVDV